ncbi:MAG: hypothetical protein P1U39_02605 [Legionellaceae bacterium]|nr:hypothetical protein [Legionellaceae bacterium]
MLFTEINHVFFPSQDAQRAMPETTPYAEFTASHNGIDDLNQELTLLEAALDALNATGEAIYKTPLELLERGKKLRQRYDTIRDVEGTDMSFRDYLFYLHAYRISLTFARLNIAQTLSLFSFDHMARVLDAPVQTLYFFSFALLGMRLLLNVLNAVKHTFFPSPEEEAGLPSVFQRLYYELSLIFTQILNDLVWASANLFTNYPHLLGLSNPAVNAVLLICLTFDLMLSIYMYSQNEDAYAKKLLEYQTALARMDPGDINIEVITMQRKQLELNYLGERAKFEQFLAAGAVILLAFSLIASSAYPFFLPLGAALCVFGTALYLTAGKRGECVKAPSPEHDEAYLTSLVKNTVSPLLFMFMAASLGWPLAILIAAPIMILDNKEAIIDVLPEAFQPTQGLHLD